MLNQFRNYLIQNNYREFSDKGSPSTAIDYPWRLSKIMEREQITLKTLSDHITDYIELYGRTGKKSNVGRLSHSSYINALKLFKKFILTQLNEHITIPNQPQTQQTNLI